MKRVRLTMAVGFTTVYTEEMHVSPARQWQQRGLPPHRVLRQDSCHPLPAHPRQPGCSWMWIRKQLHESGSGDRGCRRKREISFPFSDYSNEWPMISAPSHFHEMLKPAQKLPQQPRAQWQPSRGRSGKGLDGRSLPLLCLCRALCPSCRAAPGNQPCWQPTHKPLRFGVCSITVALGCRSVSLATAL